MVVDERDPEHCRVEQVPRVAALNRCPAALLDPDEPALLEQLQALADRRATEAELLAERRLGRQHGALAECAAENPVSDLLDDDRCHSRRACCVRFRSSTGRAGALRLLSRSSMPKHHMFWFRGHDADPEAPGPRYGPLR